MEGEVKRFSADRGRVIVPATFLLSATDREDPMKLEITYCVP